MITDTVIKFWEHIDKAQFDMLSDVMAAEANVILPNTNEIFYGRENYIKFNKDYPGRWYADVKKMFIAEDEIVTAVHISDKQGLDFYVTSFFKFRNKAIIEITEYWGENSQTPKWRLEKGYSQEYRA